MRHPVIRPTKSGHPDSLYIPNPIRVRVGQSITWTNHDSDPHDVTSDSGLFYSSPIASGASWTWTPRKPGIYPYFCTIHPDMHGEIIVHS
jgi:plastocyanin